MWTYTVNGHGAGVIRMVFSDSGTAAGASKCTHCKGKGKSRCGECKNGVIPCEEKPSSEPCRECRGGRIPCPRCKSRG